MGLDGKDGPTKSNQVKPDKHFQWGPCREAEPVPASLCMLGEYAHDDTVSGVEALTKGEFTMRRSIHLAILVLRLGCQLLGSFVPCFLSDPRGEVWQRCAEHDLACLSLSTL
jgi:hypothetical protein